MEKVMEDKTILLFICIIIIIFQSIFIYRMQPIDNEQRMDKVTELLEEYSSLCYGGICVNDNTTMENMKDIIKSDGYGYKTYMGMVTNAGLACVCDGHCSTIEGYAK